MADGGSILNQNSFAAIKVHFGSSLSIVDAELRNLIDFLYGFMSIQLEKIQHNLTADEPSANAEPSANVEPSNVETLSHLS